MADDLLVGSRRAIRLGRRAGAGAPGSPGNRPSPRRWIHRRRTSRRVAGRFVDAAVADGVSGRPVPVGRAAVRARSAGLSSDHPRVAVRVERGPVHRLRDPHRARPKPQGHGAADVGAGTAGGKPPPSDEPDRRLESRSASSRRRSRRRCSGGGRRSIRRLSCGGCWSSRSCSTRSAPRWACFRCISPSSSCRRSSAHLGSRLNDMYLESLTYEGVGGERIVRPPGLSDQPGGAATAGALTVVLGAGLSIAARSTGVRALHAGCRRGRARRDLPDAGAVASADVGRRAGGHGRHAVQAGSGRRRPAGSRSVRACS